MKEQKEDIARLRKLLIATDDIKLEPVPAQRDGERARAGLSLVDTISSPNTSETLSKMNPVIANDDMKIAPVKSHRYIQTEMQERCLYLKIAPVQTNKDAREVSIPRNRPGTDNSLAFQFA